jgi:hypothetical protein
MSTQNNVLRMPQDTLDVARELTRQGFYVVPIPAREKGPKIPGWQQLRLKAEDLPGYFANRSNVGVLLGIDGLTDIDKDCEEAIYISDCFLPPTGLEFGRQTAPGSHSLYYSDPPLPQRKFEDAVLARKNAEVAIADRQKSTIIEIRGTKTDGEIGLQTVFPGSVHHTGERIDYVGGTSRLPANIEAEELGSAVERIAAAVMLARYFPSVGGGRNEAFLAVNGVLVRAGWSHDEIYTFSLAIRRILYRDRINETHCRAELEHTEREHAEGKPLLGIPALKRLVHPIAVSQAFDWLEISSNPTSQSDGLPEIVANANLHLRDKADAALKALHAKNNPTTLFLYGNHLARIVHDHETDRCLVSKHSEDSFRHELERSANWVKITADGEHKPVSPPIDVVKDLMSVPEQTGFPPLASITESPILASDGRIVAEPGYDADSRIYYSPKQDFKLGDVAESPTREDARIAAEYVLNELLVDFPFTEDGASRTNTLAALLTPILRPSINGPTPLFVIDATTAGSGKSLLAEVIALVATGSEAAMRSMPNNDEEIRKAITSILVKNPGAVVVFDNLNGLVKSGELARAITARVWSDRLLGESTIADIPVRCTWFATGNNVAVGGDLARRCCHIRIDTAMARPFERTGFRHPQLLEWIAINRGNLIAALLTMARAWILAGRPSGSVSPLGSFEQWSSIVSGVLKYSGVEGFMENRHSFYEAADFDSSEWETFLLAVRAWKVNHAKQTFTAAELIQQMEYSSRLAALFPLGSKHELSARSLGMALKNRKDRRYGEYGVRLRIEAGRILTYKIEADIDPPENELKEPMAA